MPPPDYVTVAPGGSSPDSAGTPNPLGITVTWQAVPHASGYTVQWDTDPDFNTSTENDGQAPQSKAAQTSADGNTLTDYIDQLDQDAVYYVRIKANGSSSYTGSNYGPLAGPAAPARRMFAPKNLTLELSDSGNVITASWEAAEGAANGYSLERDQVASFDSDSFVLEEFPQPTQLTHPTSKLSYGSEYYFRLRTRAVPGFVQSVRLVASQRTKLAAPTNLAMLTALSGQAQIRLSWTAVPNASGYNVEWGTDTKFDHPQSAKVAGGEKTFFYLQNLVAGTTYHVRVQAYGEGFPASAYTLGSKDAQIGSTVNLGDITFSGPSDTTSIVGMREFLLTVTRKNQLSNPATVYFIVSADDSPPAWSDVENNPARIARTFGGANPKVRKIYFSITDKYRRKAPAEVSRVDLSGTSKSQEEEKSRREAPGIMLPGNPYYVYAYNNGQHVATSDLITTLDYPPYPQDALPKQFDDSGNTPVPFSPPAFTPPYSKYAVRMDVWQSIVTNQNNQNLSSKPKLEVGKQDIVYIPFRYLSMVEQNSVRVIFCPGNLPNDPKGGTDGNLVLQGFDKYGVANSILQFKLGQVSIVGDSFVASPSVFVASPRLPLAPAASNRNQVLDAMLKVKTGIFAYTITTSCFDSLGPVPIDGVPLYYLEYVDD